MGLTLLASMRTPLTVLLIHTPLISLLEQNLGCHPQFILMKSFCIIMTSTGRTGMMDLAEIFGMYRESQSNLNGKLLLLVSGWQAQATSICSVYRLPDSSFEYLQALCNDLEHLIKEYSDSPMWIGGDMNLPNID